MDYKFTGIILNKKDIGETDRIYTIYTLESGKIRAKATGVRKANAKLAGFLENFTLAEIFTAKSHGIGKITGSLVLDNFSEIRKNLEITQSVFKNLQLFNNLIKEENKDSEVFKLLKEYLETMDQLAKKGMPERADIISLGFVFKLLNELGYKIEANDCASCGEKIREVDNFFSAEQGGIVCGRCSSKLMKKVRINPNSIKLIRIFFQNTLKSVVKLKAEKKDTDNLKIISREFLSWID